MRLFLVRHGLAVGRNAAGGSDDARWLTAAGRSRLRASAQAMGPFVGAGAVIYASPLVRAVQTAEIFVAGLGLTAEVEIWMSLAPETATGAILRRLAGETAPELLLVGHEPHMSGLCQALQGDATAPGAAPFAPGAVACLESVDGGPVTRGARLRWLLQPDDQRFVDEQGREVRSP